MGDPGLRSLRDEIKNRDAGRLAARSGRRGDGNQRFERTGNGKTASDWRIDEVEKVGRVSRVEVGRLGRVDRAAAANGHERVEISATGSARCLPKAGVGRLDD